MSERSKKAIVFIDISNFTYKSSLITDLQMEKLLKNFEEAVFSASKNHAIEVVKSIGDAYLCFANEVESAKKFSFEAIENAKKYDDSVHIDLLKIAPRATITFGDVNFKDSQTMSDYFGEAINLASRMMDVTPRYGIFVDTKASLEISKKDICDSVGKFHFQGVLQEQEVFSLKKLNKTEKNIVLRGGKDEISLLFESCDELVFRASCVAAILMLQPIPFIESYNIIAVHLYMVIKISQKFGRPVNLKSGSKIFLEIITPLSLGYIGIQGIGSLSKILLPGVGGMIFAPITFAVTYALGKVYTAYFFSQVSGKELSSSEIKSIFYKQKNLGKQIMKSRKKEVYKIGKEFSSDVLSIKETPGYKKIQSEVLEMLNSKK